MCVCDSECHSVDRDTHTQQTLKFLICLYICLYICLALASRWRYNTMGAFIPSTYNILEPRHQNIYIYIYIERERENEAQHIHEESQSLRIESPSLGHLKDILGASLGHLRGIFGQFSCYGTRLLQSRNRGCVYGSFSSCLEAWWGHLGAILGSSWSHLGPSRAPLGPS